MLSTTTPLRDSLPGIDLLPGQPTVDLVGGPVCRHLDGAGALSWQALAEMSPRDILDLSHMGQKRLDSLIENVVELLGSSSLEPGMSGTVDGTLDPSAAAALREIASWAVSKGVPGGLLGAITAAVSSTEVDTPIRAIEQLRSTDPAGIADDAAIRRYDPVVVAHSLIESFTEREQAILERVLDLDRSAPTLEQVGARYSVTRERIRQIEQKVVTRIETARTSTDYVALIAAANRLARRFGAAVPLEQVLQDFSEFPPDLVDRLVLFLAGPYRIVDGWLLSSDVVDSLERFTLSAFETVSSNGWATLEALQDALVERGILAAHIDAVTVAADSKLRVVDELVVDWRGSMADKSERILELTGDAMSSVELAEAVGAASTNSLLGQLDSSRFVRVGKARHALASWDMKEYQGIVHAMVERIAAAGGPVDVDALAEEVAAEYGASLKSVPILASTHPAFLLDSRQVRLRTPDQPYVPTQQLRDTARCYLIDGIWRWRYRVDKDVLRGSGRPMPESVAVALGAEPLGRHHVRTPYGELLLSWLHQPTMGSTRGAARELAADDGDDMVMVCRSNADVDFAVLHRDELPTDPARRLRALIGVGEAGDLAEVLAAALDLDRDDGWTLSAVRRALVRRREHDLVELLDTL